MRSSAAAGQVPANESSYRGAAVRVIAGLWVAAIVYTIAVSPLAARSAIRGSVLGAPVVEQIILLVQRVPDVESVTSELTVR